MEKEDIYTFYREEIDSEFASVWTKVIDDPNYSDSCDVRIDCTDGYYCHSHQTLLSISSKCFRHAFDYYYRNTTQKIPTNEELVISLPQFIPSQELESIINFIYIGFVTIPESRVFAFLEVSKFLGIKGLEDMVLNFELNKPEDNDICEPVITPVITSSQFTQIKEYSKFEIKSNQSEKKLELIEKIPNKSFTSLKSCPKEALVSRTANLVKKKYSSMVSTINRVRLQGRRPQIGSPLITEDFKFGDRYQCKVCLRTYLWKKSLVRHYKDLHPEDVELVS